uniref:Abnormal cell migration protein 18-like fibronectin type I domain-containing protein n=1 Tax=Ditylenchus dipsaci TaxID=166011 RepID=A0A915EBZ2_9BILA
MMKEITNAIAYENLEEGCLPISDSFNGQKMQEEGCFIDNQSSRLRIGENFDLGNHTYQCQKRFNGMVQMCAIGCIYNGNHFKIGEQYMDGEFVFYCKGGKNGKICQRICIGCQVGDQRLYNGDRYRKENTAFQCVVRPNRSLHKPVACVTEGGIERVVGCKWRTTTKDSKVEQTCVVRKGRSLIETTGCVFTHKGYDRFFLYPGTYTLWSEFMDGEKMGVKCGDANDQKSAPLLETFSLAEMEQKTAGLKYDQPRG